jgi:hypothetical protein
MIPHVPSSFGLKMPVLHYVGDSFVLVVADDDATVVIYYVVVEKMNSAAAAVVVVLLVVASLFLVHATKYSAVGSVCFAVVDAVLLLLAEGDMKSMETHYSVGLDKEQTPMCFCPHHHHRYSTVVAVGIEMAHCTAACFPEVINTVSMKMGVVGGLAVVEWWNFPVACYHCSTCILLVEDTREVVKDRYSETTRDCVGAWKVEMEEEVEVEGKSRTTTDRPVWQCLRAVSVAVLRLELQTLHPRRQ